MQQFFTTHPDLFAQVLSLALTIVTLIIGWAATRMGQRAGIDIEQRHIDRITAAIRHVATESLADGRTDVAEITAIAGAYLRQQLPDAMKAVSPSADAIRTIAAAHLATTIEFARLDSLRETVAQH